MHKIQKTVWILEDDVFISEALQIILEEHGYIVNLYDSYKNMKVALSKKIPNIILMDVWLDNEDGIEVTQKIKKTLDVPIILISANILSSDQISSSTADAFLKKPFELTELVTIVKKFSH